MKILFVFDVAGIACIYAKYLRKLGHECRVISRANQDGFGFLKFYGEDSWNLTSRIYVRKVIDEAKNYDIIHISSIFEVAHHFKEYYPNKKLLITYAGSESVIHKDNPMKRECDEQIVDKVLVNTKDLLEYQKNAIWVPQPIDREHFKPMPEIQKYPKASLTFSMRYNDMDKLKEAMKGVPLEIHDREKHPIQYADMPAFLNHYEAYIDMKFDHHRGLAKVRSCTALQALACGLKVIDHEKNALTQFPEEHDAKNSINKLVEVYNSL